MSPAVRPFLLIPLALLTILAACGRQPDYRSPDLSASLEREWQIAKSGHYSSEQPDNRWWDQFHDRQLSALIDQLFTTNLALKAARERVVEAMARRGVVAADRQLQLAAALGYTSTKTGKETITMQRVPQNTKVEIYTVGTVADWELDLWGRIARLTEAAEADIGAAYSDQQAMRVSLAAETALAYMELRTLEARRLTIDEDIALQQETVALARDLYQAGNGTELAVVRSEQQLASTKARGFALDRDLSEVGNRINVLLGKPPGQVIIGPGTMPTPPRLIGLGLPADLLTRRADIHRQFEQYRAELARVGAAKAERYPRLTISGTLTLSSDTFGSVFDLDTMYYTVGPALQLPLFTGGRITSNIAMHTSRVEQARLTLEQQIIEALAEVEKSGAGVIRSEQQTEQLRQAEEAAQRSVALSQDLYRHGLVDFFQVLDNQQRLVTSQESLLLARQQELADVVALYRALGGGWQEKTTTEISGDQASTTQP
ncbi:MAG: efflux transporter outer membrane subunit [Desulfopila sp.]